MHFFGELRCCTLDGSGKREFPRPAIRHELRFSAFSYFSFGPKFVITLFLNASAFLYSTVCTALELQIMDLCDRKVGWDAFESGGDVLKFRVDVQY